MTLQEPGLGFPSCTGFHPCPTYWPQDTTIIVAEKCGKPLETFYLFTSAIQEDLTAPV